MIRRKQVIDTLTELDIYYFIDYIDNEIKVHSGRPFNSPDRVKFLNEQKSRAQNQIKLLQSQPNTVYVKVGSKYRHLRIGESRF